MKLVIVESPTKAKTLAKYLPKEDYIIASSRGHVRDLPKKGLGVDIEQNFTPEYEVPTKAKKVVAELKKLSESVDEVILATDPDREGEAIAWHLQSVLSPKEGKSSKKRKELKFSRVFFHELTKDAVINAFENATQVNKDLVNAQQARRVLDRLVGYKLSPLLWKKVQYGLSAGRVQSVAVRLIVERERERQSFKIEEYWSISANFLTETGASFIAELIDMKKDEMDSIVQEESDLEGEGLDSESQENAKRPRKILVPNKDEAQKVEEDIKSDEFKILEIKQNLRNRQPPPPFKTSSLQSTAANVFGYQAKKTMSIAQKLFEKGFITYHRTDSLNLSSVFVEEVRSKLKRELGNDFISATPRFFKNNSKNAQEAHEAIRPTSIENTPFKVKSSFSEDEYKIYSLIWQRSLECQSVPAKYMQTRIDILSGKGYLFRANGSIIIFEGWLGVGKKLGTPVLPVLISEMSPLPKLDKKARIELKDTKKEQHFTQPPARYSDATLIKKLEDLEVGRPSTYAPTISTIESRKYVQREGRYFVPTPVAFVVNDLLVEHFPSIVDYDFTAEMEKDLDEVAEGNREWTKLMKDFFDPFSETLGKKEKELNKKDVTTLAQTDKICPKCGSSLVVKLGKYGKFLSCTGYPKCDYAEPMEEDKVFDERGNEITEFGKCDKCDTGVMLLKQGKFGKFLACSNYPKCKNTQPFLDKIGIKCPKCQEGDVVRKKYRGREFFGCSRYPDCDYSSWKDPKVISQNVQLDA